jgi:hypothetical protein
VTYWINNGVASEYVDGGLAREDVWTDDKGLIHYRKVTYVGGVIDANKEEKRANSKGFTKNRTMQKLASVPAQVWYEWAKRVGFWEMDNEAKKVARFRFLKDHPEYMTVEHQVTPQANVGNIIIK